MTQNKFGLSRRRMRANVVVTDCWLEPGMCLLSRLGRIAAGDSRLLGLDSQLPLVACQVGGGGHQRIYGPHRARHKLDIPEPSSKNLFEEGSKTNLFTSICW